MNHSDELYHYGVIGMKWGVRRYQPYNPTGKRMSRKEKKEAKKQYEAKVKRLAKARATKAANAKAAQKDAARRAKILNDPRLLNKYSDEFTTSELKDAYSRLQVKGDISNLASEKIKRGATYVSSLATMTTSGIKLYNDLSAVANYILEANDINKTIDPIYRPDTNSKVKGKSK